MLNRACLQTGFLVVMGALLCVTVAVVLWGANRGLGFGDEGIYLLAARYPSEVQQNVSAIFLFTGAMFRLVNYDPTLFRILGVILVLLSSLIFYIGIIKLIVVLHPTAYSIKFLHLFSLIFIAAGGILHYQWSYLTPSYYTLTAIVVNVFCGLVLLGLAWLEVKKIRLSYLVGLMAGVVIGATLFFKFTTAIPLFLMSIVLILFWNRIAFSLRMWYLIALLVGFIIWLISYFIFEQTPVRAMEMFKEGWRLYQTLELLYDPVRKLIAYPLDLLVLVYTAIFNYWLCYLIFIFGLIIKSRCIASDETAKLHEFSLTLNWFVLIVALLMSLYGGIFVDVPGRLISRPINGRTLAYVGFALGWLILLGTLYLFNSPQSRFSRIRLTSIGLLYLFLFFTPIAGSLGTSNPLYNVISFYSVPWFGLIILLLIMLSLRYGSDSALLAFVILTMSGYIFSNVIQGSVFQPAQIKPRNLFDQSIETDVGDPPFRLKLDRETHHIIQELSISAKSNGFLPGGDIIAFDQIAGLVYAMGGRSPGHPVFTCCSWSSYNEYSKIALGFSNPARLKRAFILLDVEPDDSIPSILADVGINFPDDYRLLITVRGLGKTYLLYRPINM